MMTCATCGHPNYDHDNTQETVGCSRMMDCGNYNVESCKCKEY